VLGAFTDQAYNLILLAEDEARMLGRAEVEPEHVLLALSRYGNVESLLAERAISGRDIYGAIVRASGLGPDLVLGPVPRSKATDDALERAVEAAARRGIRAPSSEHVLLGLSQDPSVNALVRELGIHDVERLVDARYPVRRAPLSLEEAKSYALRVGTKRAPPSPGPIPPLFERFTTSARSAVAAGERIAAELMHEYVAPFHLLLGLLRTEGSLAGDVLRRHNLDADQAIRRAQLLGPGRSHQTTGIFTHEARRIVAEDALRYVNLHGHGSIGTGHVLLATLATDGVVTKLLGEERVAGAVATEIVDRLPGDEDSNTGLHDHT
jgi:ATP-dependent Clp protease ATP-binding subunit ClpA